MAIEHISNISSVVSLPSKSKIAAHEAITKMVEAKELDKGEPEKGVLEAAVKKLNAMMVQSNTSVEFSLDKTTGSPVIKVLDTETKSVLRQLPNLEAIAFSKSLDTFKGFLLNQKV